MNEATDPKEMDIYFRNGVIRCKYCKGEKRTKWPMTLGDLMEGLLEREINEFKAAHTNCALEAFGHTQN